MSDLNPHPKPTPLLLLKTRSQPADNYHDYFTSHPNSFSPTFIPVLTHTMNPEPLLRHFSPSTPFHKTYGGLIFTSQRAVEALDAVLHQLSAPTSSSPSSSSLTQTAANPPRTPRHAGETLTDAFRAGPTEGYLPPLYTVGPATSAALQKVADEHFAVEARKTGPAGQTPYPVLGRETGNGEKLAEFILEDYHPPALESDANDGVGGDRPRAPLLFFVGEQRRDIIPRTLMNEALPAVRRVRVDEEVVYETAVEGGFEEAFREELARRRDEVGETGRVWVVVFSPTGCGVMLRVLGWTREGGWPESAMTKGDGGRRIYVATIGPTTRDYMRTEWGFEADVCAKRPSPEGIAVAIDEFTKNTK